MNKNSTVSKLPYRCKEVLELYGTLKKETNQLEKLKKVFVKEGIIAEMYYSNKDTLSYATLVVFLPWTFHVEVSKFDPKAFKTWHSQKEAYRSRKQKKGRSR